MKTTFLYTLSDPETGGIRYLGKSDEPFKRYKRHLYDRDASHKSRWVHELRSRGLKPHMDLLDEIPHSQWKFWEREYIRVFKAIGIRLVNLTDGGDSGPNMEDLPEDTKNRIRSGGKFVRSQEQRKNMSEATRGLPKSSSHRAALSRSKMGTKMSAQARENMRLSGLKRWEKMSLEEREALVANLAPSHAIGHPNRYFGKKNGGVS